MLTQVDCALAKKRRVNFYLAIVGDENEMSLFQGGKRVAKLNENIFLILYSSTHTDSLFLLFVYVRRSILYVSISDINAMNLYNNRETQFAFTQRRVAFMPSEFHRSGFRESL